MECTRCFFAKSGAVEDARCPSCGRSYRPAVNVYLGLVTLVYLVLVRYVHYVLTGNLFALKPRPSWLVFDWARFPVDVVCRPEFILILGAMIALLIFVPVAMAILYGKRGGFLLAAIALIVGPSWLLGALLIVGVWIAGGWTLRLSSKVGSAILACAPLWVFCLVTSQPRTDVVLPGAYYLPAMAAVVIDVALSFLVLVPMRLTGWRARPAGIVLSVLCVLPIGAYQTWIGSDEIEYALLSQSVGSQSGLFVDIPGSKVIEELLADVRKQEADERAKETEERAKEAAGEMVRDRSRLRLPDLPDDTGDEEGRLQARLANLKVLFESKLRGGLHDQKVSVVRRCLEFLRLYPDSRRAPDVLFTMARALDMDVDTGALRDPDASNLPIIFNWSRIRVADSEQILGELAAEFPGHAYRSSADMWKALLDRFPESVYSASAHVKLADHAGRQGAFAEAVAAYENVLRTYGPEVDKPLPDISNLSVFTDLLDVGNRLRARKRAERIDEQYRIAQRDHAFLVENLNCPHCRNEALKAFLEITLFEVPDVRREKLVALQKQCPSCRLADNIAYELALLEPRLTSAVDPSTGQQTREGRMDLLLKVSRDRKGTDGAAQALLALAELEANIASNRALHLNKAIGYYKELLGDYPGSYMARIAEQKIRFLQTAVMSNGSAAKTEGAAP